MPAASALVVGALEAAAPAATSEAPKKEVRHYKHPSGGYKPGSPLYKEQQERLDPGKASIEIQEAEDRQATAIAWMLMGSVSFVMALFYLVNYHKASIRRSTWKALNMTVSIFASVLIYTRIHGVMLWALGLHARSHILQTLLLFLLSYAGFNVMLFIFRRKDHMKLVAVTTLCAHVTSFSAMYGFACLLEQAVEEYKSGLFLLSVVILAPAVLIALAMIAAKIRAHVVMADFVIDEAEKEWIEQTQDVENDVMAIAVGFLMMQTARYAITGEFQPFEPAERPPKSITQMNAHILLACAILAGGLTFVATQQANVVLSDGGRDSIQVPEQVKRYLRIAQNIFAQCMAWCLLFWGEWQTYVLGFSGTRMFGVLMIALFLTAICLMSILGLDWCADRMQVGGGKRSLQSLELALGMVIGFSWEKAFDLALESIGESLEEFHGFTPNWCIFLRTALFCGMLAVVLPAWLLYVLPKAVGGPHADAKVT